VNVDSLPQSSYPSSPSKDRDSTLTGLHHIYQDKLKRQITLIDTEDAEDSGEEQEVAIAKWTRGANPVSCKWVKQQGPTKGFDFDESKVEQIFDLLLREKQLKLPESHKFPTAQELQGRPYCKWHHLFTHNTNDCKELCQQIQSAIEQGRLILGQFAMKVDTRPFPGVNMVEGHRDSSERSARRRLDFSFHVNMAGAPRSREEEKGASPRDRPRKVEKKYITEEQVRHVWYQRPLSTHLLKKYEYQYRQCHQYESEDEEYERRTWKSLKKREDSSDHWHCPFFKHCWNSGMSRLPTVDNCPECRPQKHDPRKVSEFQLIGPMPPKTIWPSHHVKRTLKGQKISITSRAGALADLVILKNAGYSGCTIWRKPRPSTLRC
jgi:hypothetical protein